MNTVNEKENCVKAICNFVRVYRSDDLRTPIEIYRQTGYSAYHDKITIDDIESEIRHDPSLVQEWIMFSEDKRWTPAWAFQGSEESWTVSFIESSGKSSQKVNFKNGFRACAEMVRNEMEQFRCRA
jgi:hypothetical protein